MEINNLSVIRHGNQQSMWGTEKWLVEHGREMGKAIQRIWVSQGPNLVSHDWVTVKNYSRSNLVQWRWWWQAQVFSTMNGVLPTSPPLPAWTAPYSQSGQSTSPTHVSVSWPASGMTNTVMSSPEPSFSLGNRQPRSFSTPRDLISRSCAASVYLWDMQPHAVKRAPYSWTCITAMSSSSVWMSLQFLCRKGSC